MIEMRHIHSTATIATGKEKFPRWKGPLLKFSRFQTRRAIGIPYEMYSPIVAILYVTRWPCVNGLMTVAKVHFIPGYRSERNVTPQTWKPKDEGQRTSEPNCSGW